MSDYDGIRLCENCGEYTTGTLCTSCNQQQQIDNDNGYDPTVDYGGLYDYDDYYYDYEDDYEDYDHDNGFMYYPLTRRERWHYNITHLREYIPVLYKRIVHRLRYSLDIKYRNSIDEIPF